MSTLGRMTRWLPVLLYSGLICYFSSAPPPAIADSGVPGADKLLHVGAFVVWALLFSCGLDSTCRGLAGGWFISIVMVAGALYGLSDEFHQSFVDGRTADPWDLLADTTGSLAGAFLAFSWMRRRREIESSSP